MFEGLNIKKKKKKKIKFNKLLCKLWLIDICIPNSALDMLKQDSVAAVKFYGGVLRKRRIKKSIKRHCLIIRTSH